MESELNLALAAATEWARKAGDVLMEHFRSSTLEVARKSTDRDLVSTADFASEALLLAAIAETYPEDGILTEEGGALGEGKKLWCLDPLDGTVNFVQGLPLFAVSVARLQDGVPDVAVVHLPVLQETWTACRGGGCFRNGQAVQISEKASLAESVLATGFPYRRQFLADNNLENFGRLFLHVRGLRRSGSAAIDLAWTAGGRLDAFWELHLSPWDVAAGGLLVSEAGGVVDTIQPGGDWVQGRNLLAGPSPLVQALRERLLDGRGAEYPPLGDRTPS